LYIQLFYRSITAGGQAAQSNQEVGSAGVPSQLEPAVGDIQSGPSFYLFI